MDTDDKGYTITYDTVKVSLNYYRFRVFMVIDVFDSLSLSNYEVSAMF